jgi:DNA-binding CsgD family transcriptional regulator/tetratricopeptide (TPR) repeat protein
VARRISSPRFVGRSVELGVLDAALARAAAGAGRAVLVEGEAGIGKSRLMAQLESRAGARGAAVLAGECLPLAEGELAFAPIVAALRSVIEDADLLATLEPALRAAIGALWPSAQPSAARPGEREQLFEGVYRLVAMLARRAPVLLIIEDVHWIDPSSRDLLLFLVHNARRDRIAVVATYRGDELDRGHPLRPFLAELERSGRAERIELGGLGYAEVAELIAAISGRSPDPGSVQAIFARSEGNPFYVEELLGGVEDARGGLPSSLREALLLRIERLAPQASGVLAGAAVIGRSVDHRLLASVVTDPEDELLVALRDAAEHHVLVTVGSGVAYRFRHALLREAIYEDTLPGERLRLHRAVAQTLTARPELATGDVSASAELAHHWYAAGELPAALAASVQAAADAARVHAHPEALRHLGRALELWDKVPDAAALAGTDRFGLLLRTADMGEYNGNDKLSLELTLQARRLVDERLDPVRAAEAETQIGRALWNGGRADDALEHLARAVRLVPERPPSLERARALAAYGRLLMLNGLFSQALEPLEEALALSDHLNAREVKANALNTVGLVYNQLGDWKRAIASGREGLRIATELGDGSEMLRGYINGSQVIDNAGRVEEALALGLQGISTGHRLGLDRAAGDQLRFQAAWRLIRLGRFAQAEDVIRPSVEGATLSFNIAGAGSAAGYLAGVRGELDLAQELLEPAWELMQHSGSFQLIGLALGWKIALHLWRGELERARRLARDGVEQAAAAEGQLIYTAELYWLAARIEADMAERSRASRRESDGAEEAAAAAVDKLAGAIGQTPGDGAPPAALAYELLARAELARARATRDPHAWRTAGTSFVSLGHAYHAAYAEMRTCEALALAAAPTRDVAGPLRAAYAAALELGMRPFRVEIEDLARRTGIVLSASGRSRADLRAELGLTDREIEVLALVADGRSNREIAHELFITSKTASAHVSHILLKLGVPNRAAAAAAAHRFGLTREHVAQP